MVVKVFKTFLLIVIIGISTLALYENREAVNNMRFRMMNWDPCTATSFVHNNYTINELPYAKLPYANNDQNNNPHHRNANNLYDDEGILLLEHNGKKIYHAVYLAQYSLHLLDKYHQTKNAEYLDEVVKISGKLQGLALKIDSTLWFPYVYDFVLHGRRYMDAMRAPWYSALAQGQILSLFTRLFEETQDTAYLAISHKVYNSFYHHKYNNDLWVSCIDKNNNIWFEEYPAEMPCFTLNGMIYAIYGIYDYYRITKRIDAKKLLMGAITTIENNIDRYRNEGNASYYCLKHKIDAADYHEIHVQQLNKLFLITGEQKFKEASGQFESDTQ